ncbi:MAG: group III truncated hemoglobin [Bacteroidota bacterium]
MTDIRDKADIKILINAFYQQVRKDDRLGSVFAARIPDEEWPIHLEKMYGFWNSVLFAQHDYRGRPFAKHALLPIEDLHFERWLLLFGQTVDAHFSGPKAEEAKMRAGKIGELFQSKLAFLRSQEGYKRLI